MSANEYSTISGLTAEVQAINGPMKRIGEPVSRFNPAGNGEAAVSLARRNHSESTLIPIRSGERTPTTTGMRAQRR